MEGTVSALFLEIQTIGQKYSFPVVDVGSWWGDVDSRSVRYLTIDTHPNAHGHEILAAGMADFLMTQGLVTAAVPNVTTIRRSSRNQASRFPESERSEHHD